MDLHLQTKDREAQHLVLFRKNTTITGAFIVGDGIQIECTTNSVAANILVLLATYYVNCLEYPRIYSQVLAIFQTHLIKLVPYGQQTSNSYRSFSELLRRQLNKTD